MKLKTIEEILHSLEYTICGKTLTDIPVECVINWMQGGNGIYGLLCEPTNKILIGEGKIGFQSNNRLSTHINESKTSNKQFLQDRNFYGIEKIKLLFFKYEDNPIIRLYEESELQKYYIDLNMSYNTLQIKNVGKKIKRGKTSQFYGVHYDLLYNRWIAKCSFYGTNNINHQSFKLGCYDREIDAAKIYDYFVFNKKIAKPINFPKINYTKYSPPKMKSNKYNQYIKEILDLNEISAT